jgi:hypothetical protein
VSESPDAQQTRSSLHRRPPDSGPECAYVRDLAASYVMTALEPDEHRRIDRHRNRCQRCDGAIAEIRATVSYLAFAGPQVAPPVRAKLALMERIAQASQTEYLFPQPAIATPTLTIPSSQGALAPIPEGWEPANPSTRGPLSEKTDQSRWFRRNWHLLATPLATVPLVLALGIVGVWAMNTQNRLSARSAQVQTLSLQVNDLNDRVKTLDNTLADVDKFIEAADAIHYDMSASTSSSPSKAVGQVIANPGTDEAMLVVKGLGGGHATYEVLLESNAGRMVSAGELPVSADGAGKAVLKLSQPFSSYRSVHIKPKLDNEVSPSSDTVLPSAPDALVGVIDPNLGNSGDTDVPDVGQSS